MLSHYLVNSLFAHSCILIICELSFSLLMLIRCPLNCQFARSCSSASLPMHLFMPFHLLWAVRLFTHAHSLSVHSLSTCLLCSPFTHQCFLSFIQLPPCSLMLSHRLLHLVCLLMVIDHLCPFAHSCSFIVCELSVCKHTHSLSAQISVCSLILIHRLWTVHSLT